MSTLPHISVLGNLDSRHIYFNILPYSLSIKHTEYTQKILNGSLRKRFNFFSIESSLWKTQPVKDCDTSEMSIEIILCMLVYRIFIICLCNNAYCPESCLKYLLFCTFGNKQLGKTSSEHLGWFITDLAKIYFLKPKYTFSVTALKYRNICIMTSLWWE